MPIYMLKHLNADLYNKTMYLIYVLVCFDNVLNLLNLNILVIIKSRSCYFIGCESVLHSNYVSVIYASIYSKPYICYLIR